MPVENSVRSEKQRTRRKTVLSQLATSLGPAWGAQPNASMSVTRSSAIGKRKRKPTDHFVPSVESTWKRAPRRVVTSTTTTENSSSASARGKSGRGRRQVQRTSHPQSRKGQHAQQTQTQTQLQKKRSRGRPKRDPQEQRLIDAAHASRLHAHSMSMEEFNLFHDHLSNADVESYLNTRNTLLALWRDSPKVPLTWTTAFEATKDLGLHKALIPHVYEFLFRSGYINFGMCPFQQESRHSDSGGVTHVGTNDRFAPVHSTREQQQKTIVVVGAGIAGVGVARQLENLFAYYADRFGHNMPPKVVVLEGRSRIGGRMHSMELATKPVGTSKKSEAREESSNGSTDGSEDSIHSTNTNRNNNNTRPMWRHAVDLGAQIITGFENGNPMEIIVRRQMTDLPLHYLDHENCDLFEHAGNPVDKTMDVHCEAVFNEILEQACDLRKRDVLPKQLTSYLGERAKTDAHGPGRVKSASLPTLGHSMDYFIENHPEFKTWSEKELGLIHWHYANLEFANATPLDQLSLRHWDQDDEYEFSGPHCMVVQGYGQVPVNLSKGLDVRLNKAVSSIKRVKGEKKGSTSEKEKSVHVECKDGTVYDCCAAVVTVPLGVLKNRQIRFLPALPEWKEQAIQHLGYGLLNKLILVFEKPFWDTTVGLFGYVGSGGDGGTFAKGYDLKAYRSSRGKFYMFWNCVVVSGLPVLVTLMAGQSAYDCESTPKEELVQEALETLRLIHPTIDHIPEPLETVVTRWSQDEFARGSYSFVGKEGTGVDYDGLAKPIDDQLYFAGEATSRHYPATAHGAYLSGLKVAKDILDSLIGPQDLSGSSLSDSGKRPLSDRIQTLEDAHTDAESPPPASPSGYGRLPSQGHGQNVHMVYRD
ncbi:hypothetical protein BGZ94_006464 [Podila epigama]|nr:hypothetical protein BGZ94_006464 [Podila epigama]